MATATAEILVAAEPVPSTKGRSRKALKQKNPSSNDTNINIVQGAVAPPESSVGKENEGSAPQKKSKKADPKAKLKQSSEESFFERELREMQEKFEKLKVEKELTEEMLKAREESLKQKDQEQEKLKMEIKKLQKIKEFKPTMAFPIGISLKGEDQEKKDKKKADPVKKKPSPPYVLWCKDQWNEVKKANPDADFKTMSNLLGAKWKTVTAEEKRPYEETYQSEKEVYLKIVGNEKRQHEAMKLLEEEQKQRAAMELLEQYLEFKQETEEENKKKSKKERDPLKPKKPLSAYFIFANECRDALLTEKTNILEVAKITGEEWKNMTEKRKALYELMASKNKEQYMQEMGLYKQKKDEESANIRKEEDELMKIQKQEAMQLLKKKEKTENLIKKSKANCQKEKGEKNVDPNKPKKPASSFLLFRNEAIKKLAEERPGINKTTLSALISVKWKDMSEDEKQVWNHKAGEAMEIYKKEMEEYNKKLEAETNT